ncbi:MAG: hypothetical protein Q8L55_14185 [Phycisphaerales bacterium]|nr:hypothetical protein [Phycisphaerales bacterium]
MRLSDIMGNMDLAIYPTLALVLFAGVFVLVTARALRTDRRTRAGWARLPLEVEGSAQADRSTAQETSR